MTAGRLALPATTLLERETELRAIDASLEAARHGDGQLLVIEGEAGIGKSSLIEHATASAADSGFRVLSARGSELEHEYPYGVAVALFEPLVRDDSDALSELFAGPAALTASLLGSAAEEGPGIAGDPFATIHGLYWLALNASEHRPLLLAVDDAQWADDASLRFLHYLGQRVRELPIHLVLAFRPAEGASDNEVGHLFRGDRAALHLRPAALSESAVGELLSASGEPGTRASLRRACWDATRGNPFFVTELIWELRHGGLEQGTTGHREVHSLVPERVMRFVDARIARLDGGAHRVAEAVAILDEEATLRRAAALARLDEGEAIEHSRRLSRAAIFDSSGQPAFIHPIVRSVVYASIPGVARLRAHREAALLLHDDGAPLGVLGAQLLAAERTGDPTVVRILNDAAAEAISRGQPAVAASLLRRALDEPPTDDQRTAILLELARAEAAAGSPSAVELYDHALSRTTDHRARASLLLELGHALVAAADHAAAADVFRRGIDELADPDDLLMGRLEAGLVATAWFALQHRPMAERISARIVGAPTLGPAHRELAMSIAFQRSISGAADAQQVLELVRRALSEAPLETLVTEGQLVELATGVLFSTDELLWEIDLLSRGIDVIQRAGSFAKLGLYSVARSWPDYFTGRLSDAVADTQAGMRAAELGWESFYPTACAVQGMAHIERGDLQAAEEVLSVDPARWARRADWLAVPIARARLFVALGDPRRAVGELRAAAEFATAAGVRNPGPPEWRTWLAVTLTRMRQHDEARRLAAEAVDIARAWGAHWPIGTALRAAGIAEGGSGGIDLLREALAHLDASPARLEQARALVDLGAALRRRGHLTEARDVLTTGMDLAHRIGALAVLDRSRAELRAAGARPRRYALTGVDSLTPSESRVAHLAADGDTNREIAEALFVTPKAVEFHLANAYRKLGIPSRRELASALAGDRETQGAA